MFNLFHDKFGLYYFRHLQGKTPRIKFNLPHPGIYTSNCDFKIVKAVPIEIPVNLPDLPEYDRNDIKDFTIIDNPNLKGSPARIFPKKGIIEKGRSLYKFPKPVRVFILLHEIGHFFYGVTKQDIEKANSMNEKDGLAFINKKKFEGERKCDLFALIKFLQMGYNRSTAFYSLKKVLCRSQENVNRIKALAAGIQTTQQKNIYE